MSFRRELDQVVDKYSTKMLKLPKLDLLEVMCSSESELVKQATLMGGRAKRFGSAEVVFHIGHTGSKKPVVQSGMRPMEPLERAKHGEISSGFA